jgi:hypothetical protein
VAHQLSEELRFGWFAELQRVGGDQVGLELETLMRLELGVGR